LTLISAGISIIFFPPTPTPPLTAQCRRPPRPRTLVPLRRPLSLCFNPVSNFSFLPLTLNTGPCLWIVPLLLPVLENGDECCGIVWLYQILHFKVILFSSLFTHACCTMQEQINTETAYAIFHGLLYVSMYVTASAADCSLVEIGEFAPVCKALSHRFWNWCNAFGTKALTFSTGCVTNRC
jgi:hypothetical protein